MINGLRIKKYIDDKGIKQTFLSEKSGIPPVTLNQILNDNRRLEVNEYAHICMSLNLPLDFFKDEKVNE